MATITRIAFTFDRSICYRCVIKEKGRSTVQRFDELMTAPSCRPSERREDKERKKQRWRATSRPSVSDEGHRWTVFILGKRGHQLQQRLVCRDVGLGGHSHRVRHTAETRGVTLGRPLKTEKNNNQKKGEKNMQQLSNETAEKKTSAATNYYFCRRLIG